MPKDLIHHLLNSRLGFPQLFNLILKGNVGIGKPTSTVPIRNILNSHHHGQNLLWYHFDNGKKLKTHGRTGAKDDKLN